MNYYQEIDYPMDLKTMENKNNHYLYHSIKAFHNDMTLMFNNCRKFNNVYDFTFFLIHSLSLLRIILLKLNIYIIV